MNFYDCKGGPGTTEPPCGACVTCLHRVIESNEAEIATLKERIKRLEIAGDTLATVTIRNGRSHDQWHEAKEAKP